jgi:hypothetical protein
MRTLAHKRPQKVTNVTEATQGHNAASRPELVGISRSSALRASDLPAI